MPVGVVGHCVLVIRSSIYAHGFLSGLFTNLFHTVFRKIRLLVKVKKTRCTGEDSGTAKLNEEKVREIKKLLSENKLTQNEIGIKYNVSHRTISNIKIGKSWSHVI